MIWIRDDLPPREAFKTVLHECRHSWQRQNGKPLSDQDAEGFANEMMEKHSRRAHEFADANGTRTKFVTSNEERRFYESRGFDVVIEYAR